MLSLVEAFIGFFSRIIETNKGGGPGRRGPGTSNQVSDRAGHTGFSEICLCGERSGFALGREQDRRQDFFFEPGREIGETSGPDFMSHIVFPVSERHL